MADQCAEVIAEIAELVVPAEAALRKAVGIFLPFVHDADFHKALEERLMAQGCTAGNARDAVQCLVGTARFLEVAR